MLPDTIGNKYDGEIKGSEFPDEIITIGGHMDSWDPAKKVLMTMEQAWYKALRY